MASGIVMYSCSGILGGLPSNIAAPPDDYLINIIVTEHAQTAGQPNRLGAFGAGGPPSSPVIVGEFQDISSRTDSTGAALNEFINVKFVTSSTAEISGTVPGLTPLPAADISSIPNTSGTLLCRFRESNDTNVVAQNGVFRALDLSAAFMAGTDGEIFPNDAVDGVTVQAAQLADTAGFTGNTSWTRIDSGGAGSPPELSLQNQSMSASVHDYHIIVSCSPQNVGTKIDWAFFVQIEFL